MKRETRHELSHIYVEICNIMDSTQYYTSQEIRQGKAEFFLCMMSADKRSRKSYITLLQNEIASARPVGRHGIYDFAREREMEAIIEAIRNFEV